jgi:hypothetical protein
MLHTAIHLGIWQHHNQYQHLDIIFSPTIENTMRINRMQSRKMREGEMCPSRMCRDFCNTVLESVFERNRITSAELTAIGGTHQADLAVEQLEIDRGSGE